MVVFTCSRCDHPNSNGNTKPSGSCTTCPDGAALCDKCSSRHVKDAIFADHAFSIHEYERPGEVLLLRANLVPVPKSCMRHGGQPFSTVICAECAFDSGLCVDCIREHSEAFPLHTLTSRLLKAPVIRKGFTETVHTALSGCCNRAVNRSSAKSTSLPPPLVACARHKAISAKKELDALTSYVDSTMRQLEANRDAIFARTTTGYLTRVAALKVVAEAKRAALESELAEADSALSQAVQATDFLIEVRNSPD